MKNNHSLTEIKLLVDKLTNVFFGGRLAEYKYYDIH